MPSLLRQCKSDAVAREACRCQDDTLDMVRMEELRGMHPIYTNLGSCMLRFGSEAAGPSRRTPP
jgi:hypothetical protein